MLSIRRLGFASQRLAVGLSAESARRVTVTLIGAVPVLPTITDDKRAACVKDVGFDERSADRGTF